MITSFYVHYIDHKHKYMHVYFVISLCPTFLGYVVSLCSYHVVSASHIYIHILQMRTYANYQTHHNTQAWAHKLASRA